MSRPRFIDRRQFFLLTAITVTGTTFLMLPREMASRADTAGWLSVLLAGVGGVVLAWILIKLGRRFPELTPVQYAEQLLGKVLGKALGVVVVVAGHYYLAVLLRQFAATFLIPFMPETPPVVFISVMALLLAYGVYQGLTGIARTAQVFLPLIVVSLLFIFFGAAAQFKVGRLLPLLGDGPVSVGTGAWHSLAYVGELFFMAFMLPSLRHKPDYGPALFRGVILSVLVLSGFTALSIGILGAPMLKTLTFPILSVARIIRIGPFFERFEVVFVLVWFILAFLKLSVLFLVVLISMSDVLEIGDPRQLALAVATVVSFLAMVPPNEMMWLKYASYVPRYGQILEYGLPALLLIVMSFRRKGGRRDARSKQGA